MQDVPGQLSLPLFESVPSTGRDTKRKRNKRANHCKSEVANRAEPISVAEIEADEPSAADPQRS